MIQQQMQYQEQLKIQREQMELQKQQHQEEMRLIREDMKNKHNTADAPKETTPLSGAKK